MGVKLVIPGTLPNLNDYITAEKADRAYYHSLRQNPASGGVFQCPGGYAVHLV